MSRSDTEKPNMPLALNEIPTEEMLASLKDRFPTLEPAAVEAHLLLLRVASDIMLKMETFFQKHDLSRGRFSPLVKLYLCPNQRLQPSELAERTGVTRATMTGLIDGLEKSGLVKRVEHASDRRALEIELTSQGRKLMDKMMPLHFKRIALIMDGLTDQDRRGLGRSFRKIHANLDKLKD